MGGSNKEGVDRILRLEDGLCCVVRWVRFLVVDQFHWSIKFIFMLGGFVDTVTGDLGCEPVQFKLLDLLWGELKL